MNRLLLAIAFISLSLTLNSQSLRRADRLFEQFKFEDAAEIYERAVIKDPANYILKERLAQCYTAIGQYDMASSVYAQLINIPNTESIHHWNYARSLHHAGNYAKAEEQYLLYADKNAYDSRVLPFADLQAKVDEILNGASRFEILIGGMNTEGIEIGPAFYGDDLAYCSDGGEESYVTKTDNWSSSSFLKAFQVGITAGGFMETEPVELSLPGKFHVGSMVFTEDGQTVYYTANQKKKSEDGTYKLAIYKASKVEDKWKDSELVAFCSGEENYAFPSLSSDGKRMFFSSDREGGYGQMDLYVSYLKEGKWAAPINLGNLINTPGSEVTPFITVDFDLIFASDEHVGLGGFDLYTASYSGGSWGGVQNIGLPINSVSDDLFMIEKDDQGYFVTNRDGNMNIYSLKRNDKVHQLEINVLNADTDEPLEGAIVKFYKENAMQAQLLTTADGKASSYFEEGTYTVQIDRSSFMPETLSMSTLQESATIYLRPEKSVRLKVNVTETGLGPISNAQVTIVPKYSAQPEMRLTNALGDTYFALDVNNEYKVAAWAESDVEGVGYLKQERTVTTDVQMVNETIELNFALELVKEGTVVESSEEDVYFDVGSSVIKSEATVVLDEIIKMLTENPSMEVEISSHTDCQGSYDDNMQLSADRAISVVRYLQDNGISSSRLLAVGFGSMKPKNDCLPENCSTCTPEQHSENRRTEFKIIKF